jgi:hypothetical protein
MGSQKSDRSNKFVTEKIGGLNSSFNVDKLEKMSLEPPPETVAIKDGASNNEFRQPMPMSTRFQEG